MEAKALHEQYLRQQDEQAERARALRYATENKISDKAFEKEFMDEAANLAKSEELKKKVDEYDKTHVTD